MHCRPSYPAVADQDGTRALCAWLDYVPQEIYNIIYDLTFTCDEGVPFALDKTYKPPAILQVSWAIRASLLPTHFGGCFYGELASVHEWASSLPLHHQGLLGDNSLVCFGFYEPAGDSSSPEKELIEAFAQQKESSLNMCFHARLSSAWSNASLGPYFVCISATEM